MANKARPGKIRTKSGAKKRFKLTGKKRYASNKSAHNHLLGQKSKRQKRLFGHSIVGSDVFNKQLKRQLPHLS